MQDLQVEVENENTATVSWNTPLDLDLCNIEYTVTAKNEDLNEDQLDTCSGTSNCEITLSDLCPSTVFSVVATSIDGTAVAEAEEVAYTHNCELVNVIKASA